MKYIDIYMFICIKQTTTSLIFLYELITLLSAKQELFNYPYYTYFIIYQLRSTPSADTLLDRGLHPLESVVG